MFGRNVKIAASQGSFEIEKALEEKNITPINAEVEWIPTTTVPLNDSEAEEVSKLVERLEQDDDVQKVFHNMG